MPDDAASIDSQISGPLAEWDKQEGGDTNKNGLVRIPGPFNW